MKLITKTLLILISAAATVNCSAQKKSDFKPTEVYKSETLVITQISENAFQHTSFLQTQDFGSKVPCNGLIVRSKNETIVFDTPTNDKTSEELIQWITGKLNCKINAIIPTHFHNDCLGGLNAFHEKNIPSYANLKTIELAKDQNLAVPNHSFQDSLKLSVGSEYVTAKFFGEGHTIDNVVGYFPSENIMFGGCLIKEVDASKGFLGDANVAAWSATVTKVKAAYPHVKLIIPGHGEYGDKKLLDYTITLFKTP